MIKDSLLSAFVIFFLFTNQANATLVTLEGSLNYLFDDRTGYVWDLDLSRFGNMSYNQQVAALNDYETVFDVNQDGVLDTLSWQFLTVDLAVDMTTYLGFSFVGSGYESQRINGPLENSSPLLQFIDALVMANEATAETRDNTFWWGRIEGGGEMYLTSKMANIDDAYQGLLELGGFSPPEFKLAPRNAWVVASVSYGVTPVPEPTTTLLFGLGAAGFAGVARRRKK